MFSEANRIKILIADDNREFCGILRDYFNNDSDFEIVGICNNGTEVLEIIEKTPIEVLILDLIMPYMDGIGVLEKINELNIEPRPRIIILTASSSDRPRDIRYSIWSWAILPTAAS